MNFIADLHIHTVASTHATSTVAEVVHAAMRLGYKAAAITDHGPGIADAPHKWYFNNLLQIPDIVEDGFLLLKGVEANVMDLSGTLDMPESLLAKLDWVACSLHKHCIAPKDCAAITELWLSVAENPLVDMIGHPEEEIFRFDYDLVTRAFAAKNKVVELNANSRRTRPGNGENLRQLALCCKRNSVKVAVNSDAHTVYCMNQLGHIREMLAEIEFPEELVINSSAERLMDELALHGKDIVRRVGGKL